MSREAILQALKNSLLWAQQYLATMVFKEPMSSPSMTPFQKFLAFIRTYEGANPGNNNPYDFRYYPGGYLPKYGTVKESPGGFAMFKTLALGTIYGETCIREMIDNHPQWSFNDFFNRFAPPSENDTATYALRAAETFSVEPTANLKNTLNM